MIGVCSWSLQPSGPEDLACKVRSVGVNAVQLALDPIREGAWPLDETVSTLRSAGVEIRSGMMAMRGEDYSTLETIRKTGGVAPDEYWEDNLLAAQKNAELAQLIGITMVTLHAGFLPHDHADPSRAKMIDRLRAIVDTFDSQGVRVGLETGQETAEVLLAVLSELNDSPAFVNFDPANMILYGMGNPVDALESLAGHVAQIHIKDAIKAPKPGVWGEEVAVGTGDVDWPSFFEVIRNAALDSDLMIEREQGNCRIDDIQTARLLIEQHLANQGGQPS